MPSKHANAGRLVQRGLYDDLRSFTELEQRICTLGDENTKIVGDAFEIFVEAYLATHQKMQAETVWLVGQIPLDIRLKLNLPNDAKGIDGVFGTRTGTLVPYQVKFRSQRAYLTYTEIAPFLGLTERATDRIVFTNANELAQDVKNRDAMRTVRGIDFDDLTEDDFRAISCWLREQPVAIPKLSPRDPEQIEALKRISETLAKSDRAHVVMACGTGKTLVALWAAEALKPTTVLVLVPSLMLLQQILDDWSRHNNWGTAFSYICVCSDPELLSDKNDTIAIRRSDAEFRVDTDPDVVRRFIERYTPNSVKVVFSTYQSSPIVSEGMRGLPPFDIAVFDEAHKTATREGSFFRHSLSNENVRIQKRLFLTATPRKYDIRHRDREGDFNFASMNDETVYGPRAYTLTFGEAAQLGIICNYKVVISVVDGQEINNFALKHGITLVESDLIRARWVANQIAVERAIEKTGAKRAITFHSRVSSAKEFSADGARGIKQFLSEFSIFHVNGEQKSSERKQLIRAFRDAPKALITNARCLTEGIDVPAVDMVAFIDPRHSKIDIAQATGRAMRKPHGLDKEVGYIVIPLFLERESGETLEEALERSDFSDVANVLNAMQEQDDDLVQIIRELQVARGEGSLFDPIRLLDKIEVLGPSVELSTLKSNIIAEITDLIGLRWDVMFGRLLAFQAQYQHCLVPSSFGDGTLATWNEKNRAKKKAGTLKPERGQALNQIGFDWDPRESKWQGMYERLKKYAVTHGHCCPPRSEDRELAHWVYEQRFAYPLGRLSVDRKQKLDEIGFVFNVPEGAWLETYNELKSFFQQYGNIDVPESLDAKLVSWIRIQRVRYHKGDLEKHRVAMLNELGVSWTPSQDKWEARFARLQKIHNLGGSLAASDLRWIAKQRAKYRSGKLHKDKIAKLESLEISWSPDEDFWNLMYGRLVSVAKSNEGSCHVPYDHPDKQLFIWVTNQRALKRKGLLGPDRVQKLDAIKFDWDPAHNARQLGERLVPSKQLRRRSPPRFIKT
jgi:superfamily II DNA or RNA helicase